MVQFTYRDLVISLPSGVNATVTDEGVLEIRGLSRAAPIRMKPCDDERVISSSCTPSERPLPASGTLHKRARTTAPLGCGSVPLSSVDGGDMDESASCGEAVAPPVYPNGGCSDSDEECGGGEQPHDGCPSDDDEHPAAVTSQGLWNAAKAVLDEGAEKAEVPPPVLPPTASLHAFPFPPEAPLRRWEWRPVETTGPTPPARWAHCAAALGGKMLVYGGEALSAAGADGPPQLSDLHAFDAASGEWRRCQDAPHGRAWHTGTVVRGSLDGSSDIFLVFGGEAARPAGRAKGKAAAGGKPQSLSSMLSYDPEFEVWYEAVDRGHRPSARSGHAACLHEQNDASRLLVWGGFSHSSRRFLEPELHELVPSNDWAWRRPLTAGRPPAGCAYASATRLSGGRVLFFGGNDAECSFAQPHLLDLATMEWTSPAASGEVPRPRTGHAAVCLDGERVLVYGGWDYTADGEGFDFRDDAAILDTRSWSWSVPSIQGPPPPCRVGHSLVSLPTAGDGRALFLFGGRTEGDRGLGDLFALSPLDH